MNPAKLLLTPILIVAATLLFGVWFATQWTAARLGYQPQLGAPWFLFWGTPIYRPWQIFPWWYHFDAYAPKIFARGGEIAGASGCLACLFAFAGSLWRARETRLVTTYGSARWATARDVKRAGLLTDSGIFLGRMSGQYLRSDGPQHVLAFAPTRSGKGVGLVIPTLLSWTESAVIHDIKGENWERTAGWRSRFSHCLLFDPTDVTSAHFNPLLEVRRGRHEVRDAQNIADILVDPDGSLERRDHWDRTSHALLVGVILHVLYIEEEKTLARVATFLSDPQRNFPATLKLMMSTPHLGDKVHPVIASAAREVLNKSENERSGVLSTALSFLSIYRDPLIAEITARSDWRISDLVGAELPVSLYLVVPPSDISRTKPLLRLVLNQIGRRLTERAYAGGGHHKLLMMLDEFPALGKLDFFETSLAFMAGYGIRAFLIAQSLNQIEKAYGEHSSILDNCHVRVAFASNDERTAKRISDSLGTATEQRAMRNYAGHRLAPWLSHMMVSRQETARPLLTPGEVMQLPAAEELVLVSGSPPIKAQKLCYYTDPNFAHREITPPALAEDRYADRPSPQPHDWSTFRGVDVAPKASPAKKPAADAQVEAARAKADSGAEHDNDRGEERHAPPSRSSVKNHAATLGFDRRDLEPGDDRQGQDQARSAQMMAIEPSREAEADKEQQR
jgi:type IV secretion system protein VirD4